MNRRLKKGPVIILCLIVFLLIGSLFVSVGIQYLSKPKTVFFGIMKGATDSIVEVFEGGPFSHLFGSNSSFDGNIQLVFDPEMGLGNEPMSFEIQYMDDKEKVKQLLDMKIVAAGEEMISVHTLLKDNKTYFKLSSAMENYYYSEGEELALLPNIDPTLLSHYFDVLLKSYQKVMTDSDFLKKNTTISLNNKDVKVKKYDYVLTREKDIQLSKSFLELLKEDELATQFYMKMEGLSKDQVFTSLEEEIKDLEGQEDYRIIPVSFYVSGFNRIVMIELMDEESKLTYQNYDGKTEVHFSCPSDEEGDDITFVYTSDDRTVNISLEDDDLELTVALEKTDETHFDVVSSYNYNGIILEFDGNSRVEEVDDEIAYSLIGSFEFKVAGERYEMGIDCSFISKKESMIIDVMKDAKNIDSLTEEELAQFYREFMEIPIMKKLMEFAGEVEGSL